MKKIIFLHLVTLLLITLTSCKAQDIYINNSIGTPQNIYSKYLDEDRVFTINLPQNYTSTNKTYPVLYLLDGDVSALVYEALSAASYLHNFEGTPEFIIVAVSTRENRDRYFIPNDNSDKEQTEINLFQKFINEELQTFINNNYRATNYNILYGGSNAGLYSIYNLLTEPESFDAIIVSSPTIGHCPTLILKKFESFVQNGFNKYKKIYINHGETDTPRATEYVPELYSYLKNNLPADYPVTFEVIKSQGHVPFGSIFNGLKFILVNTE